MTFTDTQIGHLTSPLSSKHVKTREQGRSTLSYVESWHAIAEANRIFGFDAWNRETISAACVSERERKIGKPPYEKDGWGVTYTAKVRVTVGDVVREGTGAGHGIDVDLGLAHESAIKEAESDAMKRALMTFGNPFGLALYDKTQANVSDERAPSKAPTRPVESPKTFAAYGATITAAKTSDDLKDAFAAIWKSSLSQEDKDTLKTAYEAKKVELANPGYVEPSFDNMQSEHHGDRA